MKQNVQKKKTTQDIWPFPILNYKKVAQCKSCLLVSSVQETTTCIRIVPLAENILLWESDYVCKIKNGFNKGLDKQILFSFQNNLSFSNWQSRWTLGEEIFWIFRREDISFCEYKPVSWKYGYAFSFFFLLVEMSVATQDNPTLLLSIYSLASKLPVQFLSFYSHHNADICDAI